MEPRDDALGQGALSGEEAADEAIRAAAREPAATGRPGGTGLADDGCEPSTGGATTRGGADVGPAGVKGPGAIAGPDEETGLPGRQRDSVYGASQADG